MKSKVNIMFASGRQRWMGGVLVSCALGMGNSPMAWAAEATDVQGAALTAAEKVQLNELAEKWYEIEADLKANYPDLASTPEFKSVLRGVLNLADAEISATQKLNARSKFITDALGGGAKISPYARTQVITAPVFTTARVDANGNSEASVATSNNVADALLAVGDSVKNTANAAVKYDDASDKEQLTLNPGGQAARLTNVQAGAVSALSTDAVNGSQLSSSNERIGQLGTQLGELATRTGSDIAAAKAYTDANVVTVRQSIQAVQGVATQNALSVGKVNAEVAKLQNGVGGAFQVSARSNLRQPQASGKEAVAGGSAARAVGDESVAIGARARAEGVGSTAVGSDAKAIAGNSVALGADSLADRRNTVSVGQAGAERQITNVKAGSRGTDAANIAQLTRATAAVNEQANAYTDQRYAQLHRDLKQQDSTLSAGIAGAMAMANLPRSMVAGGSMTSVAVGNYRGESALAVGISYVSPSGRWSTNFSGSTNTRNDAGAAVGLGYQW